MPPRKQRSGRAKPGLHLINESPARPLSTFQGFQRKVFDDDEQMNPKESSIRDPDTSVDLNGKSKAAPLLTPPSTLWVDNNLITKESLSIHKRKIEQVEKWLHDALYGKESIKKYRRIMALHGPAGTGKSTLIHVLSQNSELDYEIVEWNPESSRSQFSTGKWNFDADDQENNSVTTLAERFGHFLSSSTNFPSLEMGNDSSNSLRKQRKRIMFLDDLPNLSHEATKYALHQALKDHMARSSTDLDNVPLVISITENNIRLDEFGGNHAISGLKERFQETLDLRVVVPESVRNSAGFASFGFNPVAPTILRKSLQAVLERQKKRGWVSLPAPSSPRAKSAIDAIICTCNGDVRSAVNSLQLWLGRDSQKARKRDSDGLMKSTSQNTNIDMESAAGREASFAVFHALGKILYNKREGDPQVEPEARSSRLEVFPMKWSEPFRSESFPGGDLDSSDLLQELPAHLNHLHRRKSKVDVEQLWKNMPLDTSTLQAFLHQNYPLFCDDVEQCSGVMANLSDSEIIKPSYEEWFHSGLIQYYSFLITTHGTLLSLPSPITHRKGQQFRGAFLFECRRALREMYLTLDEVIFAARQTDQPIRFNLDEKDPSDAILTREKPETLVCDVLPYLSKIQPRHAKIGRIANLSWSSPHGEDSPFDGLEDHLEEDFSLNMDNDSNLYDEDGRKLNIQMTQSTSAPSDDAAETLADAAQSQDTDSEYDEIEQWD